MTQLCYTLDEAARKLDMSETVLVRLSQFFKVPESAYEEAGYLSFKGDLVFTDADMRFFGAVKERILAGEALESIKSRVKPDGTGIPPITTIAAQPQPEADIPEPPAYPPAAYAPEPTYAPEPVYAPEPEDTGYNPTYDYEEAALPAAPTPMRTYASAEPLRQAADRNFERYKAENRGPGKVFRSIMRKVGGFQQENTATPQPLSDDFPEFQTPKLRPPKLGKSKSSSLIGLPRLDEPDETAYDYDDIPATPPARAQRRPEPEPVMPTPMPEPSARRPQTRPDPVSMPVPLPAAPRARAEQPKPIERPERTVMFYDDMAPSETPWSALVEDADRNRRAMDTRLKAAAQMLKERALSQTPARKAR